MPVDSPMPPPPDSPQTIARQLPPTKRAIEARQGGWIDFLQGIPVLARFKKSVRVGSGSALVSLDGTDGQIIADGTAASLTFGDRALSGAFAQLFYASGQVQLFTGAAGEIWSVNPTSGIATLIAGSAGTWTTVAGGVGFTNSWTDFDATQTTRHQAGYMMDICGFVHLRGSIKSGTIGASAFTLPAAFRPAKQKTFAAIDGANTGQRLDITAGGAVIPTTGNNGFYSLENVLFDTRA